MSKRVEKSKQDKSRVLPRIPEMSKRVEKSKQDKSRVLPISVSDIPEEIEVNIDIEMGGYLFE